MANDIRGYSITTQPGVQKTAPLITEIVFGPRDVQRIDVIVPKGPAGFLGFAIGAAGQRLIPFNTDQWVTVNDEVLTFDMSGYHNSGSWEVITYNAGFYAHTIQTIWHLNLIAPAATQSGIQIVTNTDLNAAAAAAGATPIIQGLS